MKKKTCMLVLDTPRERFTLKTERWLTKPKNQRYRAQNLMRRPAILHTTKMNQWRSIQSSLKVKSNKNLRKIINVSVGKLSWLYVITMFKLFDCGKSPTLR